MLLLATARQSGLTVPLTEPEDLTQRKSKGPIEGFVSNGLLGSFVIFITFGNKASLE